MVKRCFALCLAVGLAPAMGQTQADLERRIQELEGRLQALERQIAEWQEKREPVAEAAAVAPAPSSGPGIELVSVSGDYRESRDTEMRLPVSGYMDFQFNRQSGQPFRPDFTRFVLLYGHSFSERIKFWSELEVEHSLVEGGEETGEVAVEQAYLDFLIRPAFNLRAGMILSPIGIINERHEPPSYNGVQRPFVETLIIPTTWRELGFGITGDLGGGFRYRAYLASSLDASRFDAANGISDGKTSGFNSSFRNPAKMARLEYSGARRLTLGASVYTGHAGFNTPGVNPGVTMADIDGRYSFRRLDVRGLFVNTWVSRAGDLNQRLELKNGVNPNIASQMRGYYIEPGVHVFPRRLRSDAIVFARYEKYNTQQSMPRGYVPLPQYDRSSWITGVTYQPNADVAVKFDYDFNDNASSVVRALNGINLGIGWWF